MTRRSRIALLAAGCIGVGGCVERTETITVRPDGSVHMKLLFETDSFAELHEGDAVPSLDGGWLVAETSKRDEEGKETFRLEAEALFRAGDELPATYAGPLNPDPDISLAFPTTVTFERRADGTYVHFRRVYAERPWAFLEAARSMRQERVDELLEGRDFEALAADEQTQLLEIVVRFEMLKHEAFARAAFRETLPDAAQDVWLHVHAELAGVVKAMDYGSILEQVLRTQADEDPDAGERWLEEEGRRFEASILEAMQTALAERGGAANANAFVRRYRWQQRFYEITEELGDDSFTIVVEMPGEIVGHNADEREGDHVMWNFSGEMIRDRELELMVTARLR